MKLKMWTIALCLISNLLFLQQDRIETTNTVDVTGDWFDSFQQTQLENAGWKQLGGDYGGHMFLKGPEVPKLRFRKSGTGAILETSPIRIPAPEDMKKMSYHERFYSEHGSIGPLEFRWSATDESDETDLLHLKFNSSVKGCDKPEVIIRVLRKSDSELIFTIVKSNSSFLKQELLGPMYRAPKATRK